MWCRPLRSCCSHSHLLLLLHLVLQELQLFSKNKEKTHQDIVTKIINDHICYTCKHFAWLILTDIKPNYTFTMLCATVVWVSETELKADMYDIQEEFAVKYRKKVNDLQRGGRGSVGE